MEKTQLAWGDLDQLTNPMGATFFEPVTWLTVHTAGNVGESARGAWTADAERTSILIASSRDTKDNPEATGPGRWLFLSVLRTWQSKKTTTPKFPKSRHLFPCVAQKFNLSICGSIFKLLTYEPCTAAF